MKSKEKNSKKVNKAVYFLGLVSLFTDISSEMIFSVFSVFFTVILGASVVLLGLVEGAADLASTSLDYLSGVISDKTGKRKICTLFGYGLSTAAKSIMLFSTTISATITFRISDRLGKSIRGPPRDAWLSNLTTRFNKGRSFGIHQALDQAGAIIGPLIAYAILANFGQTMDAFGIIFKLSVLFAVISFVFLLTVKDSSKKPLRKPLFSKQAFTFNKSFKRYLFIVALFSISYFSFGFLLLKAYFTGFEIKDIILLYTLFNLSAMLFSVPIGRLGDKIGRSKIIILSYVIYALTCFGFIFAQTKIEVALLFVMFGLFYVIDESQTKAYITDIIKIKKATAIGAYNFITGLVYLFASLITGFLWTLNPNYAFAFATTIASISAVIFITLVKKDGK